MAIADPQTITVNAVPNTLYRVGTGMNQGLFQRDDASLSLKFSHNIGKRKKRLIRVDMTKVAADPFLAGVNNKYTASCWLATDTPDVGFTNTEVKQLVDGFIAYLSAGSGAVVTKVLGGES